MPTLIGAIFQQNLPFIWACSDCNAIFELGPILHAKPFRQQAEEMNSQFEAHQLADMLTNRGFTTVVDAGPDLAYTLFLRRRIECGELLGPQNLHCRIGSLSTARYSLLLEEFAALL